MRGRNLDAKAIFKVACLIDSREARGAYLNQACGDDGGVYDRVITLLKAHDDESDFLESPAAGVAATVDLPPIAEKSGTQIGRYKLIHEIGHGGMGVVYMAVQKEPVKRKVALKIIKPGMDTREVIARFEAERQALAMMDHQSIARVLDGGSTESGRPYFVMELVEGTPINEYCDERRYSTRQRLELFVQVCQAVHHAHQKGIIHRDIKPSNILVTNADDGALPKVIDFGIAKALHQQLTEQSLYTNFAQMIGTPLYMSPEQAQRTSQDIDTRSDVYSLGVLLYELLTGTTPFDMQRLKQSGLDEFKRIIAEEEPPNPSTRLSTLDAALETVADKHHTDHRKLAQQMRGELDWIVMKSLEKERNRRYESANDFARDIRRHLDDEPVEACPPSAIYRLKKLARRNRTVVLAATAVGLALLVGTGVALWQAGEARQQAAASASVIDFINEDLFPHEQVNREVTLPDILAQASKKIADRFERQPLVAASIHHTLGKLHLQLGDIAEAERHVEWAYNLRHRELGEEHPKTIESMHVLAFIRGNEDFYRQSFEITRRSLGEGDPRTINAMGHLANLKTIQGNYQEANKLHTELLQISRRKLGAEHNATLRCMNDFAVCWGKQGRLDKAAQLHAKVLEVRRRKLGVKHSDTLLSMDNLAGVYFNQRLFQKAEKLWLEALGIRRRSLGAEHPKTLNSMNDLAVTYKCQGRYEEAEKLHKEALEIRRRTLGAEHPDTLDSIVNLGLVYYLQGRFQQAANLHRERVAFLEKKAPRNAHITGELAMLYSNLAWLNVMDAHPSVWTPSAAVDLALKAVQMAPGKADFWNSLGIAQYRAGDWEAAVTSLKKSTELTPYDSAETFFFMAMANYQLGNREEARDWFRKADTLVGKSKPNANVLMRVRKEASELLGMTKGSQPESLGKDTVTTK